MNAQQIAILIAIPLAGCAANEAPPELPQNREPGGDAKCTAEPAQRYIGEKATGETGAVILEASGARTLRWGPPRSAWTMDYRPDRIGVRYDDDMIITKIACG
jgi:Xaa-Pro aminopeptidase